MAKNINEQIEMKKDCSQEDLKKFKTQLLRYHCRMTNDCEFSTRDNEEIIRHIVMHKEIKIEQQSNVSKSDSSTITDPETRAWYEERKFGPEIKNADKFNAIKLRMAQLNSGVRNASKINVSNLNAEESTLIESTIEEFNNIEYNDEEYLNNDPVLKQKILNSENDVLVIGNLMTTILVTPQIQDWIEKNATKRFREVNLNAPELNNQKLNAEELNTIRSIVDELNEKKPNTEKLNSNKLINYIGKKLNQLIFKIYKMFENFKQFMNYMKTTILDKITILRNSSVTKPVPYQTKTAHFLQDNVKMNNEKQNLSNTKVKLTVYKTTKILTIEQYVDLSGNDATDASPCVQHPIAYRIVNIENSCSLLMVVRTPKANAFTILKVECMPIFSYEVKLVDTDF